MHAHACLEDHTYSQATVKDVLQSCRCSYLMTGLNIAIGSEHGQCDSKSDGGLLAWERFCMA